MDKIYILDGVRCDTEKQVRDHCYNYVKKGFQQDFRLAAAAYKLPIIQLIEMLDQLGHDVQEVKI